MYPAVGTATLNALLCASKMGFKSVALCGFDLAFKEDVAYCDNTKFFTDGTQIIINGNRIGKTVVKSVSGEIVTTRDDYAAFIPQCENNLKLIDDSVEIYNITDFGAYIRGLRYTTLNAIMPTSSNSINELLTKHCTEKLSLKDDLESEIDSLNELKELFSTGEINYTKIYTLKKSSLLSEYTRFDVLELVQGEFSQLQLENFVENILNAIDEIKQMILK